MSTISTVLAADGTFAEPANIISTSITVTLRGGRGSRGGNGAGQTPGAILTAQLPVALLPVDVVVGHDALNDADGADGYSGGGGPGGWHYGAAYPFVGGSGGGSTGVFDPDTGALYLEAGGGDGQTYYFGLGTAIPSTYPGGSGGGAASNTPPNGTNAGNGAGSGGASGGNGGAGNAASGGTGHGGGTNGDDASGLSSGAGVGSGALAVQGAGACFASDDVNSAVYGVGDNGVPSATFTFKVADAPLAPVLGGTLPDGTVIPIDGGFADSFDEGVTLGGSYNAPSGDTGLLQAVCLSLQTDGGAVHYWNGADFTDTSAQWVAPTTGFGGGNGAQFTVFVPPGVLDDLHDYTWTFQTEESAYGLQSPAAAPRTFHAVVAPTVEFTGPAATNDTLTPTVSWVPTTPDGSQENYRFVVYDSPQDMGFSTTPAPNPLYDTTLVNGVDTSFDIPADTLHSVRRYYGYLQIQNTEGSVPSLWTPIVFVIELLSDDTVTGLTVTAMSDPVTGSPSARLIATFDNDDETDQANFQLSVDGGATWEDCIGGLTGIVDLASTLFDIGAPFNVPLLYRARGVATVDGEGVVSEWSDPVSTDGVISNQMWLVPPTEQTIAMALQRLASTSTTTNTTSTLTPNTPAMPPGLQQSIAADQWEQLGVFRPFGKKTAIFVHGDIWEEEFDLALYFDGSARWDNFVNIRNLQDTVLIRSDMEGTRWWVTMGGDMNAGIIREAGRKRNPKRGLTIHCTPDDPFVPVNPYVPTN